MAPSVKLVLLAALLLSTAWAQTALDVECDQIPPSLYCKNDQLATHCDVHHLCKRIERRSFGRKVQLTLLYESLCPDSQRFFPKLMDFLAEYGQFVEFELVPFGNANYDQNGTLRCQHGPDECEGNRHHACVLEHVDQPLQYLNCTMLYWLYKVPLNDALEICRPYLSAAQHELVRECQNSTESDELLRHHHHRTTSGWPEAHQGVPWMFFNNVSLRAAQFHMHDLSAAVCDWYQGNEVAPKRCDKLS